MLKCLVKKWLMSKLNSVIQKNKDDIEKTRTILGVWTGRLERILAQFNTMSAYLDDGKIDDDEIENAIKGVKRIVKGW